MAARTRRAAGYLATGRGGLAAVAAAGPRDGGGARGPRESTVATVDGALTSEKLGGDEGELDRSVRARYVVLPTAGEPYLWFASDT